jgi:hypothetical protein
MSLKSRSLIYDRLEKLIEEFASIQDDDETGLTGKEPNEIIGQRFGKWVMAKMPMDGDERHVGSPRVGKVHMKDC